ncbi:MAG: LemA family protein [Peptococcaceae bacterium]|nr:LemA family protein [Peptococcaceae bacterium]
MSIWQKRPVAVAAMVLMILVGALAGGHNSLNHLRAVAAAVFTNGAAGDGAGIDRDLRERGEAAYNMVVVARKYLPEDHGLIQATLAARQSLDEAATVRHKAAADKELAAAVADLYQALGAMSLSELDAPYPRRLYTDFQSRGDSISHDPYNFRASAFNEALDTFPASLLGGLTGIQPLELFV